MKVITNVHVVNDLIVERQSQYAKRLVKVILSIFAVSHPAMPEDNSYV